MRLYNMSISLLGKIQKDVLPLKIYRNWKITLKIFRNRKKYKCYSSKADQG
jgi:hypothetical protein